MEGKASIKNAKELFGKNFIGIDELQIISDKLGIGGLDLICNACPEIPYSFEYLEKYKDTYILFLCIPYFEDGSPLTLVKMRDHFGHKSEQFEPCFYNQDWYINEQFANETTIEFKWYLVKKSVFEEYRGIQPYEVCLELPSALLCCYLFFVYYFHCKEILWKNDYLWCSDVDSFGDQIYVGRYMDVISTKKNGFEIHRYLKLKNNYSYITQLPF